MIELILVRNDSSPGHLLTAVIRKHVFADPRPYVCTFECDLKLFADRRAWFEHELQCHRLEWSCRACSHPPFRSEAGLSMHMRYRHGPFSSAAQLPALIEASRQPVDRISAAECPLCHWDITLKDLNSHMSSDETLVVTPEQFRRHLGAHMEQLALFALPRSYKYEEEDADSNEAAVMAVSDSESRHLSNTEAMSWKSVSSRGDNVDDLFPDTNIKPDIGTGPWSNQPMPMNIVLPFPRCGAAMASVEKYLCISGGLVDGVTVKNDVWLFEANETWTCYSLATKPDGLGPRVGHAAVSFREGGIVFFGGTKSSREGPLDNTLYTLATSKARPAFISVQD